MDNGTVAPFIRHRAQLHATMLLRGLLAAAGDARYLHNLARDTRQDIRTYVELAIAGDGTRRWRITELALSEHVDPLYVSRVRLETVDGAHRFIVRLERDDDR